MAAAQRISTDPLCGQHVQRRRESGRRRENNRKRTNSPVAPCATEKRRPSLPLVGPAPESEDETAAAARESLRPDAAPPPRACPPRTTHARSSSSSPNPRAAATTHHGRQPMGGRLPRDPARARTGRRCRAELRILPARGRQAAAAKWARRGEGVSGRQRRAHVARGGGRPHAHVTPEITSGKGARAARRDPPPARRTSAQAAGTGRSRRTRTPTGPKDPPAPPGPRPPTLPPPGRRSGLNYSSLILLK